MKEKEREELLASLHEIRAGQAMDPLQNEAADEGEYITALTDIADLLREKAQGAPPLSSDPVAAMLGLVPDPERALDSNALKRARKNAGLSASQLAERLTARGWEVQAGEVFRWENRSTSNVPPALIAAIAEETRTVTELLTTSTAVRTEDEALASVRKTPGFQKLVDRWARIQDMSRELAASALESRLLATAHRGDHPDSSQMLRSLEALVETVERTKGP